MTTFSLYARMMEHGTLTESPREIPDARFALPSTVNWMRALALLVGDQGLDFTSAQGAFNGVQRRIPTEPEFNSICEQLLFALNQIASLRALIAVENKADVARMAIVTWYYGVYGAATAMCAAADGGFPDTHSATAQHWDRQFAETGIALPPFSDRMSSLTDTVVESELAPIRARGKHSLTVVPTTAEQGWGCLAEYLAGTADWEQWNIKERVRDTKAFKELGATDFRTKSARDLRDAAFARRGIAFLHEASRYRGKANYRDAIFLAYGRSVPKRLEGLVADLDTVLTGFAAMAAAYVSKRVGRERWAEFMDDLEVKRSLSVSPKAEWPSPSAS